MLSLDRATAWLVYACVVLGSASAAFGCSEDEPAEQPCLRAQRICGTTAQGNVCANSLVASSDPIDACLSRAMDCQTAIACLEAEP